MDSRNDKPYYNSSVRSFPRPQVRPCRQFHVRQCFLESRDAQLRGTVQQITPTYHHPGRNAWCNSADQCPLVPPPFPAIPPFPPMYTEPSRVAFDEPPLAQSAHQKPAALAGAASSLKDDNRSCGSNSTNRKRNRARRTSSHTSKAGAKRRAAPCSAAHRSLLQDWRNVCTQRQNGEISRQCQRRRRTRRG